MLDDKIYKKCGKKDIVAFHIVILTNLSFLFNGHHFILPLRLIFATNKLLWCHCKFLNENHRQNAGECRSHDHSEKTGGQQL